MCLCLCSCVSVYKILRVYLYCLCFVHFTQMFFEARTVLLVYIIHSIICVVRMYISATFVVFYFFFFAKIKRKYTNTDKFFVVVCECICLTLCVLIFVLAFTRAVVFILLLNCCVVLLLLLLFGSFLRERFVCISSQFSVCFVINSFSSVCRRKYKSNLFSDTQNKLFLFLFFFHYFYVIVIYYPFFIVQTKEIHK